MYITRVPVIFVLAKVVCSTKSASAINTHVEQDLLFNVFYGNMHQVILFQCLGKIHTLFLSGLADMYPDHHSVYFICESSALYT